MVFLADGILKESIGIRMVGWFQRSFGRLCWPLWTLKITLFFCNMFIHNMGRVPTLRWYIWAGLKAPPWWRNAACQLDLDGHWHAELNVYMLTRLWTLFLFCEFQRFEKNKKHMVNVGRITLQPNQYFLVWPVLWTLVMPCYVVMLLALFIPVLVRYDVTLESVKNVATMSMAPLCFLSHLVCDSCSTSSL